MPDEQSEDYEVGYRRPPKHTRLKPGQSGNPQGRPKKTNDPDVLVERLLNKKIRVTDKDGVERTLTFIELYLERLAHHSLNGKPFALKLFHPLVMKYKDPEELVIDPEDEEALADYLRRIDREED